VLAPPTAERTASWPQEASHGRSFASTLFVWFATAVAATCLVFGATATNVAAAAQAAPTEVAEEAGSGEESTTADHSRRAHTRRSRRRPKPRMARRWMVRLAPWAAPLVVPTSFAPRRGPPLLTV
jgi:hypothetical protein